MMKVNMRIQYIGIVLLVLMSTMTLKAQPPMQINYQGRLIDGTNLLSGTIALRFGFYTNDVGGDPVFESTNSALAVDGFYASVIGENVTTGQIDAALALTPLWLQVTVNGTALSPRERVLAVPYARMTHGLRVSTNHSVTLNPVAGTNDIHAGAAFSVIGGGRQNRILGTSSNAVIGGGRLNQIGTNAFASVIAGGYRNLIYSNTLHAVISGGQENQIKGGAEMSSIAGGYYNTISEGASFSAIGGGWENTIHTNASRSVIAGGFFNEIGTNTQYGVIGGGQYNVMTFNNDNSVIAGGGQNTIESNAQHAAIGGGLSNLIKTNASYATIPGGSGNTVGGRSAMAAGTYAQALHNNALVWGDGTMTIASTNEYSVTMMASGGYRFFTTIGGGTNFGARLAPNATAWAATSDRNAKENFQPIDSMEILDKVSELPLSAWTYKHDPTHRRYIGPVAQDFHAAFGLGDEVTITTLDTDGVTLAAIQALAKERDALREEIQEIKRQLESIQAQR